MKTNFRKNDSDNSNENLNLDSNETKQNLSKEEFEKFIISSGAKGSFMVYRSAKKDDELGIDEL